MKLLKTNYFTHPLRDSLKESLSAIAEVYPDDLKCHINTYGTDGRRILIITDKVTKGEVENLEVLSGNEGTVFEKMIKYCFKQMNPKNEIEKIAVLNWEAGYVNIEGNNKSKSNLAKSSEAFGIYYARFVGFVRKFRPDIIVISGLEPFSYIARRHLFSHESVKPAYKFSRLFPAEIGGHKCEIMGAIDLARPCSYDPKHKDFANLIGYWCFSFIQALNGKNYYDIDKTLNPLHNTKFINIDTIEKFDSFYEKLTAAEIVSIDTEGDKLARRTAALYSLQFAFSGDKGYFIPIDHPDTPFTPKEVEYIKQKLRDYFEKGKSKYHIYQYGKHDIIQLFSQLKIRFYNHRVYDIQAGEYCLDENKKLLKAYGIKPYSLDFIAEQYGCSVYSLISFSKGDRGNIAKEGLTKRFIQYAIYDVTVPFLIHNCQLDRARKTGHKRFLTYICEQISDTILAIAQMEFTGAYIDRKQIFVLKSADGPIGKYKKEKLESFKQSKAAQKVNKYLLQKKGHTSKDMFGGDNWVFDITKPDSQELLFFNAHKLEPMDLKKSGKGKVDKAFLKQYEETNADVKNFKELKAVKTLENNFINKIYKKIMEDDDTRYDSRLRSNYGYTDVVTNRLSSSDPNLQNLIARGMWSDHLKRAFVTKSGLIIVKNDYSAHEVRDWCNESGDKALQSAFYQGLSMRLELRQLVYRNPENWEHWVKFKKDNKWDAKDEKTKKPLLSYQDKINLVKRINHPTTKEIGSLELAIEVAGDLHRLNCKRFFEVEPVEVTDDQRYDIKALVFGVIYGKTAAGLAKPKSAGGLGKSEEYCQSLIDKMFVEFKEGGEWLNEIYAYGMANNLVQTPLGMHRHLWGYLHTKPGIINAMNRRGPNSIIQGVASCIGTTSIRIMQKLFWNWFTKHGVDTHWLSVTNDVHDSAESETPIGFSPIYLYMMEHAATTLIHKRYAEVFNYKMSVGLEIEFGLGPSLDKVKKWDFTHTGLFDSIDKTIDFQEKEMKYRVNNASQMIKDAKHNWKIIREFRLREMEQTLKSKAPNTYMAITSKNVRDIGLRIN